MRDMLTINGWISPLNWWIGFSTKIYSAPKYMTSLTCRINKQGSSLALGRRHTGDLRPLHKRSGPRSVSDLWPAAVLSFSVTCSGVLPTQKSKSSLLKTQSYQSPLCKARNRSSVYIYIYLYKTACFTGCQECFYFLPSKSVRLPTFKSSLHFYPCTRSGQVFPCGPSGTNHSLCLSSQTTLCLQISCVSRMKYAPMRFSTKI